MAAIKFLLDPIVSALVVLIFGTTLTLWVFFQKKQNHSLLNFIPHFWTGLGVLGTFVSFFYNLYVEPISFAPENITQTIRGLTGAFSTSIVGVLGSLITSIIVKIKLHRLKMRELQGKHPSNPIP